VPCRRERRPGGLASFVADAAAEGAPGFKKARSIPPPPSVNAEPRWLSAGSSAAVALACERQDALTAYVVWLSLITAIAIIECHHCLCAPVERGQQEPITRRTRNAGIAAGIMRYGSSWTVIGACTLAPLALRCARQAGLLPPSLRS